MVGRRNANTAIALHLRDVAMATMFGFLCIGCTLAPLRIMTESSMCGSDAALCQITLTTCSFSFTFHSPWLLTVLSRKRSSELRWLGLESL